MPKYFWMFCGAVWHHWEARFGTTFAVVLSLMQYAYLAFGDPKYIPTWVRAFPPSIWLSVGLVLLFWGLLSIVAAGKTSERRAINASARNVPNFDLILGDTYSNYQAQDDKTRFFIIATLLNRGTPFVALGWTAKYILSTGVEEQMEPYWIVGTHVLRIGNDEVHLTTGDLLIAKTRELPIVTGGLCDGRLLFTLSGDRMAQVKASNYKIEVSCHDIEGREYKSTYVPAAEKLEELRYIHTEKIKRLYPSPETGPER